MFDVGSGEAQFADRDAEVQIVRMANQTIHARNTIITPGSSLMPLRISKYLTTYALIL